LITIPELVSAAGSTTSVLGTESPPWMRGACSSSLVPRVYAVDRPGNMAMASMYGRPFERRKRAVFYPGITCGLCRQPIRWFAEFTLYHLRGQGGGAFGPVVPSHRRCNLRAAAAKANEVRRERYGPDLRKPRRVWPGAVSLD
jgi:hypothetical protein